MGPELACVTSSAKRMELFGAGELSQKQNPRSNAAVNTKIILRVTPEGVPWSVKRVLGTTPAPSEWIQESSNLWRNTEAMFATRPPGDNTPVPRKTGRRRGISPLFIVLCALSIFAIFTAAVSQMAIERVRGTSRTLLQQRANYACEAGFIWATEWLEQQITYDNANNAMSFNTITPATVAAFNNAHTNVSLTYDTDTNVTVRITANMANNDPTAAAIPGPDGVLVQPGQVYIQTLATVGGDLAPASSRHLGGFANLGTQNFPYAIQSEGPIVLGGTRVSTYSSYDITKPSRILEYFWTYHWVKENKTSGIHTGWSLKNSAIPVNANHSVFPAAARIISNSRVKAIVMTNSHVDGPVFFGPGGVLSAAVQEIPANSSSTELDAPPVHPAESANPLYITKYKPPTDPNLVTGSSTGGINSITAGTYYKDFTLNGGTLDLVTTTGGTNEFYFTHSLNLNGVRLTIDGGHPSINTRCKIYVGNKLNMTNCAINRSDGTWNGSDWTSDSGSAPPYYSTNYLADGWSFNLEFMGVGSGSTATNAAGRTVVNITGGNSAISALFSGSSMDFNMNGGTLGGAIKCGSVNITNANVFYDVAVNLDGQAIPGYQTPPNVRDSLWGHVSWTLQGVTDYGPSLYLAAQQGLSASWPGVALPTGAIGAAAIGPGAAAPNLGSNSGSAVAAPNSAGAATVGPGGTAQAAAWANGSAAASSACPSFWASILLGQ